jgi:hypothetical protein
MKVWGFRPAGMAALKASNLGASLALRARDRKAACFTLLANLG